MPKGGLTYTAVLRRFSALFDFPQYSDTLRQRTITPFVLTGLFCDLDVTPSFQAY